MFHPIRTWLWRGPFTPLFRKFLFSGMPIASKINICAYIGTYYALGAAWIMTIVNYFVIGWFKGCKSRCPIFIRANTDPLISSDIDKYYVNSWEVWLAVIIVFTGLGNISLAVLRYRIGDYGIGAALIENMKNIPILFIFLGGVSVHVSEAILAHMFEINMTWGATAKTLEFTNFFYEVPKTLRKFWFSFSFSIICIIGMIIMAQASFIPYSWNIHQLEAVVPLSSVCVTHLLLPLALNPGLMTFAW